LAVYNDDVSHRVPLVEEINQGSLQKTKIKEAKYKEEEHKEFTSRYHDIHNLISYWNHATKSHNRHKHQIYSSLVMMAYIKNLRQKSCKR